MSLKTISKPTRATCEKGPRCIGPDGLADSRLRAQKNGQRRPKKPTNELNKRGDAFIHVGLDQLLSLSAKNKGK
jgi:hypothetical protein